MNGIWKRLALAALVGATAAALGACSDDTAGTGTAGGPCSSDAECPDGYICDLSEGLCVVDQDNQGDNQGGDNQGGDNQGGDNQDNQGDNQDNQGDNQDNQGDNQDNQGDNQDNQDDPEGDRRDGLPYDDTCVFLDRDDTFEPQEIWSFQVDDTIPYATYDGHGGNQVYQGHSIDQVMMTPVVINLDNSADGVPDVIFTTFATTEETDAHDELLPGVLRAVDGTDGSHKWSVGYQELSEAMGIPADDWDPALGFMPAGSLAAADIDGDGTVEVVGAVWAFNANGSYYPRGPLGLAAVGHDGQVKWVSEVDVALDLTWWWWGGPSIADLNGDGNAQIVVGASVFDSQGNLDWDGRDAASLVGDAGSGSNRGPIGPLSLVADVTGSGNQEVITGRAVFNYDGTLLWEVTEVAPDASELEDGYPGVADFAGDGDAEIVIVSDGKVRIHDGATGTLLWGPVNIPGSGRLGPPTIADMTGDGAPEIGIAGSNGYFVLEVDPSTFGQGLILDYSAIRVWEEETQDVSSSTTGSSVFDFNGDGTASVIYNDELYLRVFDGPTGDILFEAQNPSYTALENPVIVDVNNDGAANIVVPANDFECGDIVDGCTPGRAGVHAYGDADDNWVTTRRIWNQHSYYINNINDDGTVPANPTASYASGEHNTFRLNALTEIEPQAAPDLFPDDPYAMSDGCVVVADIWVTNGGAVQVGPGIPVSLYATDGVDKHLITVGYTQAGLAPGEAERVALDGTIADMGTWDIVVKVDDDGGVSTRNECNTENNRLVILEDVECM